jgi:DNA-binding transcriptional MocR family regulator
VSHKVKVLRSSSDVDLSGASASGGAPSQLTATIMAELMQSGALQNHISNTLQPAYARRYRTTMKAIEEFLVPLGVTLDQPSCTVVGGYFLWLSLPDPLLADDLAIRAEADEGVVVGPGSLFGVYGDTEVVDTKNKLRICFAWEREDALREGIERLGRAIKAMKETGATTSMNGNYEAKKAAY